MGTPGSKIGSDVAKSKTDKTQNIIFTVMNFVWGDFLDHYFPNVKFLIIIFIRIAKFSFKIKIYPYFNITANTKLFFKKYVPGLNVIMSHNVIKNFSITKKI